MECLQCKNANGINHYTESGHLIGYTVKHGGSSYPSLFCFKCERHALLLSVSLPGFERIIRIKVPDRNIFKSENASRLRGILNLSNTCYMNAILQVLVHTPLLHQFYLGHHKLKLRSVQLNESNDTKFLTALGNVFSEFSQLENDPIIPVKLLAVIWEVMPHLAGNKQHDAHEFFISALHTLHLEFLKLHPSTSSLIDQLFLGRLQSTVKCNVCGHTRLTVDPFWDISLEIPPSTKGPIELHDLLRTFTKVELLEIEFQILCPTCGKHTESTEQLKFKLLPKVICIHLKRSRHRKSPSPQCNKTTCTKIEKKIRFDQFMDFSLYKTNERGSSSEFKKPRLENMISKHNDMYQLYAVVKHEGTHESGHYYTYINIGSECSDSNWYKGNDHLVTPVTRKEVLNTESYLLYYKKFSRLN